MFGVCLFLLVKSDNVACLQKNEYLCHAISHLRCVVV